MKLGVLTGGGDAPGLNAVLRAVVRTAVTRYRSDVVGISRGFEGLLRPPEFWPLSPADVQGLIRRGGTILGCNRSNPFDLDGRDRSREIVDSIRWLGIEALIVIGGEGSLTIAKRLADQGVPVIGVPKTVENDLPGTDVTFGYATAIELATSAIDMLQTTGETDYRVMYLEVTGRQAGWIALNAGISGGADVVLVPEVPYDPEHVAGVIARRKGEGKSTTVVVVAEGAREEGGVPPERLPREGVAARVASRVNMVSHEDFRVTVLGHLQRGGDPNPHDRLIATRFGASAVRAAHEKDFGRMVGIQGGETVLVPLDDVVGRVKTIDVQSELVWTATSVGMSLGQPLERLSAAAAAP